MSRYSFETDIARHIWETKYRYTEGDDVVDATVEDTWWRIARELASVEHHDRAGWRSQFRDVLQDFRFLPGGRIQAGAGTKCLSPTSSLKPFGTVIGRTRLMS